LHELYTPRSSAIHHLDARVKLILTLAFILALSLTPSGAWPAYLLFLTLVLSAALLSHLGIRLVLRRALLALPFALAALPLIFTGPAPRFDWQITSTLSIPFSPAGIERFASIALRSWISVQAAIILAATTRFPDLLSALRQLHIPAVFIAIVELMWRYLFMLVDEANRLITARASRSAPLAGQRRAGGRLAWRARVTGGLAGNLFLRSLERSDRVYAAMLSRGYTGQPPVPPSGRSAALDAAQRATLAIGVVVLVMLWLFGLLTG